MKNIKIGLIGAGQIAQNFHLPIHNRLQNVDITAICDPTKSKAQLIAEKYKIPNIYTSVEEMLKNEDIDAIDLTASTDTHCEIALGCIEAGKHVLIEKPIGRSLEEARKISEAKEKHNVKVMVAMNQRFRYDAKMIKNYVSIGEVGKVFYIQAGWLQQKRGAQWKEQVSKSGGGVVIDLGISLIDSILWIYDFAPVKSVQASTFSHLHKDIEDVCVANIRFENDSIATLEMSWSLFSSKNNFYTNVYGSKGSIKINPIELFTSGDNDKEDVFKPISAKEQMSRSAIHKKSFESQIKHFINAVNDLGPVISTPQEAVETMKIVRGIYLSAKEKREVMISEIK
jgi:predicted dehydrogenase